MSKAMERLEQLHAVHRKECAQATDSTWRGLNWAVAEEVGEIIRLLSAESEPVGPWLPIVSAPRDETIVLLYRPLSALRGCQGARLVFGAFPLDSEGEWVWPIDGYADPINRDQWWEVLHKGGCYEDDSFTHWQPVFAPGG